MKYYRYTFREHARQDYEGAVTAYYEISSDFSFNRSIEVYDDGVAYSYDSSHVSDEHGILPDAEMEEEAAREYGELIDITCEKFDEIWSTTSVINR